MVIPNRIVKLKCIKIVVILSGLHCSYVLQIGNINLMSQSRGPPFVKCAKNSC
jgi:hypothetical protein